MGIEPTYHAWEARVLPLNYTRVSGVTYNGSWMRLDICQSRSWSHRWLGLDVVNPEFTR